MSYGFYGGIHPETSKTLTLDRPIKSFVPQQVTIPVLQHTGQAAETIVSVGETVKIGQMIAKPSGFISAAAHASINGKVTKISHTATPTIARTLAITIESEGGEQDFRSKELPRLDALSKDELVNIIRDAGIVGLGGAAFPTHVKLSPPKGKKIDSLILNGAECEPYLTCDHRLMIEKTKEVLKGLDIIAKILDVKDVYIAVEDNKLSAIYVLEKALRDALRPTKYSPKLVVLRTRYPQGAEKQVIKAVLNRVVPAGGLPMDVGCVAQNVGTALAIYEAVYFAKPLIERVVTISGDCVKEPMNLMVRIGTKLSDLKDVFGGFTTPPKKLIMGGPMMGISQFAFNIPITKGTTGALFFSETMVDRAKEDVCIRCGRCVDACPMGLVPTTLMSRVSKENFKEAKELGIMNCYECGACAYTCPAKIPLVDYMKYGKAKA